MQEKEKMMVMDSMNPACIKRENMNEFGFSGRVLE